MKKCEEKRASGILMDATVAPKKLFKTKLLFWSKLSSQRIIMKPWTDYTNLCKAVF